MFGTKDYFWSIYPNYMIQAGRDQHSLMAFAAMNVDLFLQQNDYDTINFFHQYFS
jgi:hypothetical protein